MVSAVAYVANREKTRAEADKLRAETARIRAETTTLLIEPDRVNRGPDTIPGWHRSGSHPEDYDIRLDHTVAHSGGRCALIEANLGARSFATLMQSVRSISMRGKRMRLSAFIKTEDVEWAALWMRVDVGEHVSVAFDNMRERPIRGTRDWQKYEVVLDVAENSLEVAFGVLLAGKGRMWADDFEFEEVGLDTPTTDLLAGQPLQPGPQNLSFEE